MADDAFKESSRATLPPSPISLGKNLDPPLASHEDLGAFHRIERLIARLPQWMRGFMHWLRKPSSRWARLPVGLLLCVGGLLWILPVLGLWMLPLGLLLLAEDIPALHRLRDRGLAWLERKRPHWFAAPPPHS